GAAIPFVPPSNHADLAQAIRQTQENLVALQRLAEQTAQLHRQFLEGQAATQHTFQSLLEHQQRLTSSVLERGGRQEGSPQEPLPPAVMPSRIAPVSAPPRAPISDDLPSEAVNGSTSFPVPAPATPAVVVAEVLLQIVAEKTGYPVEMLELDMQLDDDLGIDSIKRVEILSALQDRLPEAPAVKPEHLSSLRTLRQIIDFLGHEPGLPERETQVECRSVLVEPEAAAELPLTSIEGLEPLPTVAAAGALERLVPRA